MSLLVSNIQRMSLDDGPGIRTTVFLQGCNLHCPWCSNPETQALKGYPGWTPAPREYSTTELITELMKDSAYWGDEGGVTFSGGEPLLQAEGIREIADEFKKSNIHITIETALFVDTTKIKTLIDIVDFWYVDLKVLDKPLALKTIGGDPNVYLSGISYMIDKGLNIHFRIPCCKEVVLHEENWKEIKKICYLNKSIPVELFAVHDLGINKYRMLNRELPFYESVSLSRINELCDELKKCGSTVDVIEL